MATLNHTLSQTPLLVATLLLAPVIAYLVLRKKHKYPPSPSGLPIIGHLHYLATSTPHRVIQKLAAECGPIMRLKLGMANVVVISNEKYAKELMVTRGKNYASRSDGYLINIINENGSNLSTAVYGDHWRKMRKAAHRILTPKAVDEMDTRIQTESVCLISDLLDAAEHDRPVSQIRDNFNRFSLNLIMLKSFGRRFEDTRDPEFLSLSHAVERAFELVPVGAMEDYFPIFKLFPNKAVREMKSLKHQVHSFILGELKKLQAEINDEHVSGIQPKDEDCYAKLLLRNSGDDNLTLNEIKLLMQDMIFAGLDTTASTLHWLIAIMANHPHVQDRAFEEVDQHLNRARLPGLSDLHHLPYIRGIIKEVLRYKPVGPLGLPRSSTEDDYVDGYFIPKDTQIILNIPAIHDTMYSDQPDYKEFNPERFINEKPSDFNTGIYTFGQGRRICVGMHLAYRELFATVSKLFYAFKFESVDGKPISMEDKFGLTVSPVPYKVKITCRFPEVKELINKELRSL
ncbi:cytochrome P450 [Paraphysoderma sedebokerense]|nr:cytochrome P450 [Paraphysoderma sedebokerense]